MSQYEALSLYIDGEFVSGGGRKTQDIINPATLEVLGQLPHASDADLDRALSAAQRAFDSWKHSSPMERSAILRKAAQLSRDRAGEIGLNMTRDQGKPLAESVGEVTSCADHCDWHAEECRRIYGRVIPPRTPNVRQIVIREPIGVCAAFTPWNFPYNQAIRKISAAIGAGCSIILKGPEDSPSAVMAIARIFHDAGLPKGVLNIVWGEPAKVSDYLIRSPIVRKVSFTGSVPVGKQLAALAGAHMKRITMELGGHSPVLIFDDANIEQAAKSLAKFKIRNAGQVCVSPTRFYVQEKAYDQFLDIFVGALKNIQVGDGTAQGTEMGPLAHERRIGSMSAFVEDARQRGATIELGGAPLSQTGYFFPPTVVTNIKDDAKLMTEEPFGPIAPVVKFSNTDEVLARANSLPFGLSSYVFTNSLQTATKVSNALEAGMVNINHFGSALPETPFGGVKDSGIGSEGGTETFDGYLVTKFITHI
ncbi:NAD-dependent succinate-semialdehyde dehydrogenase [Advenella sp. WQ 585]|uniref:NAD-dependent succinate-semialdehyde dehydrogenase n=1 Tax=Advenella mandrilli TaxID=2800330 RepID=A0ABS1EEI2_9BURK|nr:NAD-dependent succinate-semialdehyde dehydrogenase [Advenella mandrilli]MBK1781418.1 NAD-dependent succinate-semialdehyde dehydrogenase [Advenella mandrilli]